MAESLKVLESKVPDILIALYGIVKAQPEITESAVTFGGRTTNEYNDYIIFVGFRPDADATVPATRESPGGYQPNDVETAPVPILLAATNANDDMEAALQRMKVIQTAVVRGITRDLTLGLGKGVTSALSTMNWQLLHTGKGAEVNVWFDVTVKAAL